MKYLNLTNASPTQRGMPLAIRKDQVITLHSNLTVREDGTAELVTYVFGPPHGTWEVQETFEQVWNQLTDADLLTLTELETNLYSMAKNCRAKS